jgi:hypothetical protein
MDYVLVSGLVRDLHITKGYEGLANSTIFEKLSDDTEVQIEFFSCFVDELRMKGSFHRVDFREGETIDFVVTIYRGVGEVHGARNPSQHLIWTLPYRTRGHIAQKKHDISSSLNVSAISGLLFAILAFSQEPGPLVECWPTILKFATTGFWIILFVNYLARRPFYKFSFEATKIFSAFGFPDPATLNLPKRHNRADKDYSKATGEPRSWDQPWRYRYTFNITRKTADDA